MVTKYILPALAAIGGAYAQCSAASATTTLSANTDATAIAGCSTYSGSIALATGVAGDVNLDGITVLTGSLLGPNITDVTSLSASTLQSIGGNLILASGANLNSINFPELGDVQELSFIALGPQYQNPGFGKLTSVQSLIIQDTFLQNLDGISLSTGTSIVTIAQNQYLTTIEVGVTAVTSMLTVTANANGRSSASFPNLATAGGIIISNVSSLSLPSLDNVTGQIYLTYNTFSTVSLPNVTSTQDFTITNNTDMTNFTVAKLSTVTGALNVRTNPALTGTISLPMLATVDGSAYFIGDFSGLLLPSLNTIQGVLDIESSKTIDSTCSSFTPLSGSEVHGSVTCNSGSGSSGSSSSSTTSSGASNTASSSSAASSTGAASMQYAPAEGSVFTVFGLLAAFFGLLM